MKGAVLIALNDFVEENFGPEAWERILENANPASGGVYTSVQNYDDEEVVALVGAVCEELKIDIQQALCQFGRYLFSVLNDKYSIFTKIQPDFYKFLASVEDVVHVEVKKLFPDAYLPTLKAVDQSDSHIVLKYISRRRMCSLAEGLIRGAAKQYGVNVSIEQPKCYCKGDDHCIIEVKTVE